MTYPKVSHTAQTDAPTSVPSSPRFPAIEEAVLAYWESDDTFRASVEQRDAGDDGSNEFVFYDGPPFANGLPHYGHLLTGYVKDLVPRYQTMRGRRVERRFGWDTHGLPAELEAMRLNGIKTTDEIVELGIEKFNEACRQSVLKYTGEWREYVTRQARWVDFDNDYRTMNPDFMESVMWAFKQLHEKGLVYEGFRVLPYCWQDETPLSNHELRMDDDVYQMRQDPAVTVGYDVDDRGRHAAASRSSSGRRPRGPCPPTSRSWSARTSSTSSWSPRRPPARPERYLIADARLASYKRELYPDSRRAHDRRRATRAPTWSGCEYTPPFSYYAGHERAFRLVPAEFVTTTDGTGLVHTAGAFGEDDKVVTDREGIEAVMPVGKDGRFTFPVTDYEGMQVFDANLQIIDHLKAATRAEGETGSVTPGTVLLRRETYDHSYPHCWRCRQPLIYKGVSSWFVEVTKVKERLMALNQEIRWVPEHIKDGQFGKWLENARDWSITRNRFWGSPVPVWKSDDEAYPRVDVYGSFEDIERDFGRLPLDKDGNADLHRPFVDELTRPNPDDPTGKSTMRRVTDVLDVWFDSGSMSFAQVHYPFENKDWFDNHFPGDFIVEYIGQTRGWFYTMHVLAGAIFDRPAFSTCLSHGIVLGTDGQKMSKSLRNYPDVREVFDRDGADAMRWFLMSSPILRGGNLVVTEQGIRDSVRQVLIPLWNSWSFFSLYANAAADGAGHEATWRTDSQHPMDRYILAKLRDHVAAMTDQLDNYEVAAACDSTRTFLDVLTNWYIRRSRERFWDEDPDAFDTLYTVLEVVCRLSAPLLPLTTEEVWRGLTGERSVHLTDWPDAETLPADEALATSMDVVRDVCSAGSALRKAANLRNRLPLSGLTVVTEADLSGFESLVADELNLKAVTVLAARRSGSGVVRRLAAAHGQRARGGSAARQGRPARDQGLQDRGLVGRRGRHRDVRWARARRG